MKKLNINSISEELKAEITEAQNIYFIAKAALDTVEFTENENKTKILANNVFIDNRGNRVLSPSHDYRMCKEDFKEFLKLLFIENKKSGLPVKKVNETIDWEFRKKVLDLEKELFKLQLETVPTEIKEDIKTMQNRYKYKEKLLDSILRLDFSIQ